MTGRQAHTFKDWSIKRKLEMSMLVVSALVVAFCCAGFLINGIIARRNVFVRQVRVLTDVIAANSSAPLAFRDQDAAHDILRSLAAETSVIFAGVLDATNGVLSTYGDSSHFRAIHIEPDGHHFESQGLCVRAPVMLDGKRLGTVAVLCSLKDYHARMLRDTVVATAILPFAILVAFVISRRLRDVIARPILDLANTARKVGETSDYSLRAKRDGQDEIGTLVEDFNHMLHRVQTSNLEIRGHLRFLETLLDTIPMPVCVTGPDGRFRACNRGFSMTLAGREREDVIGKTPAELAMSWPVSMIMLWNGQGNVFTNDIALTCADGVRREFLASSAAYRDAEGREAGTVIIFLDLTERNRATRDLAVSEARFRSLFRSAAAGIMLFDKGGRCVEFNRVARTMFMLPSSSEEEAAAKETFLPQHPALAGKVAALFAGRVMSDRFEMQLSRSDHSMFWADLSLSVVAGPDGECDAVACMLVDITQRRQLEYDLVNAASREQRRIAQDIHDSLGQTLTALTFRAQSIERSLELSGAEGREDVAQLSTLLYEAMSQARAIARGIDPVDLSDSGLPEALMTLADSVTDSCEIDCRYDGPHSVVLPGEEAGTHLYRITQEAVTNAVRHGHASCVRIAMLANGGDLTLTIADNGCGIPADARTNGIGMRSMAYRARLLNGTFAVTQDLGGGTVVRVTIPRRATQH